MCAATRKASPGPGDACNFETHPHPIQPSQRLNKCRCANNANLFKRRSRTPTWGPRHATRASPTRRAVDKAQEARTCEPYIHGAFTTHTCIWADCGPGAGGGGPLPGPAADSRQGGNHAATLMMATLMMATRRLANKRRRGLRHQCGSQTHGARRISRRQPTPRPLATHHNKHTRNRRQP